MPPLIRSFARKLPARLAAAAIVLGVWWALSLAFPPLVVPDIPTVAVSLRDILTSPDGQEAIFTTVQRLALGLASGLALGGAIGLLAGFSTRFHDVCSPIIGILQTVPPVCWVVMALVWFGFNGRPAIFIVAVSTIPYVVVNLSEGVRNVDPKLLEMAHCYRFSRAKVLRHIILPSVRPYFRSALKISTGAAWKIVVMGEVLTTSTGIGGEIVTARLNLAPEAIIAWAVVVVVLYYLCQAMFSLHLPKTLMKGPR